GGAWARGAEARRGEGVAPAPGAPPGRPGGRFPVAPSGGCRARARARPPGPAPSRRRSSLGLGIDLTPPRPTTQAGPRPVFSLEGLGRPENLSVTLATGPALASNHQPDRHNALRHHP